MKPIEIPVDIFASPTEFVVVMPLWWVKKTSVSLKCFWWPFHKRIELPANSYFNKIHSELSKDNILTVVVPKVFMPEELVVTIQ